MSRRGASTHFLFDWIYTHLILKSIIATFDKPKTVTQILKDIRQRLSLKTKPKLSLHLTALMNVKILKNLTPDIEHNTGCIYGLTRKGLQIRKLICEKDNAPFSYKTSKINWLDYGWCLTGTQKTAVILALTENPLRPFQILQNIRKFYSTRNKSIGITRQNLNDILQQMVKKGIVEIIKTRRKRKKPLNEYRLNQTGIRLKKLVSC